MSSLVLELQREAYDEKTSVSTLLRKAYVLARKLKVGELESWINDELNGYNVPYTELPEYRTVRGEVKGWNPVNGWIPVILTPEIMEIISQNKIIQSIPELEQLLKETSGSTLLIGLPHVIQERISEMVEFDTKFSLHFGKSQAVQVIQYVRNTILKWSLQLEEDNILGEGVSFTVHEKEEAQKQNYTVYNIHSNQTQIQQNTVHSQQNMVSSSEINKDQLHEFIAKLTQHLDQLELEMDNRKKLDSEITTITAQLETENPKKNIIQESLSTIRSVLEGVTGSLIASGLIYELDKVKF